MSTYPGYAQAGYVGQYPAIVPPPNQFYAPPRVTPMYNGYPVTSYQSHYRRPTDPGTHDRKPTPRRGKPSRPSEDETPRISRPSRPRKSSIRAGIAPDFIFISLSSRDVLKIANLNSTSLLDYLHEALLPSWPEKVVSENDPNGEWRIKLGNDAWCAEGRRGIMARRFICRLFTVLAEEGFGYLATVDNHPLKAPRLVFSSVPPEIQPRHFMISFSLNRRRVRIIDAPERLALLIGSALRPLPLSKSNSGATVPGALKDDWIEPRVYEVFTSEPGAGRQDMAVLMGGVLKLIASEGWRFEASVPFGKCGLLGLRGRREAWVFRKDITAPAKLPRPNHRG